MIDYSNEIFNLISKELKNQFDTIKVIGENISIPTEFPTVTVDEVSNIPTSKDSGTMNKLALVRYRVQVFSNKTKGKRAECRQIFKVVDEIMQGINLTCKSYSPLPDVYNSQIYQITASYEGVIRNDGYIFKN